MKRIYNIISKAIFLTLPLLGGVEGGLLLSSCSDDNEPDVYDVSKSLSAPTQLTLIETTASSLSFSWAAVPEAIQYGYQVCDALGNTIAGGTTSETSATVSGLSLFTDYTIKVSAIPALGNGGISQAAAIPAKTAFYECIEERTGNYSTFLANADGEYWTATLNEDRTGDDYKDGTFGVFTLKAFYNRASASLVFTVNSDNTIKILNATGYDENGWAMVNTGRPQAARKTLLIDESSSEFDRDATTLTYTAKFANTEANTETFDW